MTLEDLVTAGDIEGSITLLETEVSRLETLNPSETVNLQLASALTELAKLYSSKHFSLKSDQLLSRASLIKQRSSGVVERHLEKSSNPRDDVSPYKGSSDDDWEAIADHAPDELLSPQSLPSVSNICLEDAKVQTSKRRGRGPFTYQKHELYSDRQSDATLVNDVQDEDLGTSTQNTELTNSKYGTHHVLVLADFPPSMRTTDLEKLFEDFKDRGFVIRWINDTAALAVFRTPSIALEAHNHIQCSFTVRILGEDDELVGSIPTKESLFGKLNKNGDDDAELSQIRGSGVWASFQDFLRSGTTSSKAKDISKNCPKADSSWNGIEIADTLWFERIEEPGRN
ncbi:hypothetical protein OIU85_001041 [Salix viminalis]|uniref:Uncharacterized protein n=1 Tax=Salix viminalis TaxID=40686 RepID=A0A9Q0ZXJ8_SALVM|nr:hypothetical protein OIU85_001041 [Salix viminalis]